MSGVQTQDACMTGGYKDGSIYHMTPKKLSQKVSQQFSILLDIVNDQKKSIEIWLIKFRKSKMAAIGRKNR